MTAAIELAVFIGYRSLLSRIKLCRHVLSLTKTNYYNITVYADIMEGGKFIKLLNSYRETLIKW